MTQHATDSACHVCGTQGDVQRFLWNGRDVPLCYECWDELVGTGEESDEDDDNGD